MQSNGEIIEALRDCASEAHRIANTVPSDTIKLGMQIFGRWFVTGADALERCGASLSQCETRREALEAENTFLREEIEAAAKRHSALKSRENEMGERL